VKDFNAQAPEHLTTFTDFVTEYVSWVSNRTSGGCGLPDFFVWSYYFWKKDVEAGYYLKSPEYYRDQEFQRHIYKLNQPFLRTTQSAYTTQTVMDRNYIMGLFGGMEYPDGSLVIDYVDEILDYQLAFMKVYQECHKKNMMTFPVISYALIYDYDKGKFEDEEFAKKCSDMNCYWMDANFSVDDSVNSLSSCCRLRNDLNEINLGNFSSIGGSALEVGSVKVNSINLARLAYMYDNEEDYLTELEKIVELNCKVLHTVRHIIKRNVEKGLLPNYSLKMIDMDKQYGTIGVTGLYECVDKFGYINKDEFGYVYYSDAGISFAKKIFDAITSVKNKMTKEFGDKYNIEQIPGERACSIFMEKDKLLFPDEKYDHALYSNQHISLSERATMAERVRVGEQLDSYMGGGVITHFNTDTPISEENAWNLLNYIAGHKLKYFAFNSKQNACKHNHAFYGDICPECGGPVVSQWTRIVGFARPISSFSKARREETGTRTWDEPLCK
jgi:ribonucleoside-triphosphate reductase